MLSEYDRERLLILKRRIAVLEEPATTKEGFIRSVINWIVSDWMAEINQLEREDRQ